MARTKLTLEATEEGSYIVKCVTKDESGNAVAPVTMSWSLTDEAGTVINSRTAVAVVTPSSTEYIPLTGDDLACQVVGSDEEVRVVTVWGTYYSTLCATTLNFTADCQFDLRNMIGIS